MNLSRGDYGTIGGGGLVDGLHMCKLRFSCLEISCFPNFSLAEHSAD